MNQHNGDIFTTQKLIKKHTLLFDAIKAVTVTSLMGMLSTAVIASPLLEEIVVTAQKRAESVNDIGMSISAFKGSDLEALGLTDTRDLANLVPGLTMAISSSGTPIYTMRGVGFNTLNMSSTSPVGVYFDEVSYPYTIMSKGLAFDIERVEVLKGPQGTLYGRNTTGGLINYITNKPTETFEASVEAEVGEYQTYGIEAIVNGALSETVNARLAAKMKNSDEGWQESLSRDEELGKVDRSALKLSVTWQPTDTLSTLLSVNWWEDKSDTQAGQAINYNPEVFTPSNEAQALELFGHLFPGSTGQEIAEIMYVQPGLKDNIVANPDNKDADWAAGDQPGDWPGTTSGVRPDRFALDTEMTSYALRFDWDLNDTHTFTSISSYADLERDDLYDRSGTPYEIAVFNDNGTITSFSQEFRLTGESNNLKYIAGLFYSSDDAEDRSNPWTGQTSIINRLRVLVPAGAAAAGINDPAVLEEIRGGFRNWVNFANIESESKAVFGQIEWAASDNFDITVGLRYNKDTADFEGCSRDAGNGNILAIWNPAFGTSVQPGNCITNEFAAGEGPFPQPVDVVKRDLDEDNWSGRIGLNWQATDDALVYATYSRGYKSGAFPQQSGNIARQYDPATQEKLDAFETGLKIKAMDNLQVNVAAYFYDYEDKQVFGEVLDPVFTTLTRLVNVPKSEVYGAELDITWSPIDSLVTQLSTSYMKTEITEYVGFDKFAKLTDFAGSEFEYSPEWQSNLVISYNFNLSNKFQSRVTANASYSGEQQADFDGDPAFEIDSYTLVGLNIGVLPNDNQWEANVWIRNLTDEYYWTSVQTQTDTTFRYAGMPRTWGASFKYNF